MHAGLAPAIISFRGLTPWDRFGWFQVSPTQGQQWAHYVYYNGATLTDPELNTGLQLVTAIENIAGTSHILYLVAFIGSSVAASICPQIDRLGRGIPTPINLTTSDINNHLGLKGHSSGSGAGMFLPFVSNWVPSGAYSGNGGLFYYGRVLDTSGSTTEIIGSSSTTTGTVNGRMLLDSRAASYFLSWGDVANRAQVGSGPSGTAFILGERPSQSLRRLDSNGVTVATQTTSDGQPTQGLCVTPMGLLAMTDSASTSILYNNSTIGCAGVTDGALGQAAGALVYTALTTYLINAPVTSR